MNSLFSNFSNSERFLHVLQEGYEELDNPQNLSFENTIRFVVGSVGSSNRTAQFMNDFLKCVIKDCTALRCSRCLIIDFRMLKHLYQVSRLRLISCNNFCNFLKNVAKRSIRDCLTAEWANVIFSDQHLLRHAFYGGNWKFFSMAEMYGVLLDLSDETAHYESCRGVSMLLRFLNLPISDLVRNVQSDIDSLEFPRKRRKLVTVCFIILYEAWLNKEFETEYVKCLQLLYECTKEPMVSCEEIKQLYIVLCGRELGEICWNRVRERYMRYMPECEGACCPRTLKHLARCKVRKCLEEAGRHPDDIQPPLISRELVQHLKLDLYNMVS